MVEISEIAIMIIIVLLCGNETKGLLVLLFCHKDDLLMVPDDADKWRWMMMINNYTERW